MTLQAPGQAHGHDHLGHDHLGHDHLGQDHLPPRLLAAWSDARRGLRRVLVGGNAGGAVAALSLIHAVLGPEVGSSPEAGPSPGLGPDSALALFWVLLIFVIGLFGAWLALLAERLALHREVDHLGALRARQIELTIALDNSLGETLGPNIGTGFGPDIDADLGPAPDASDLPVVAEFHPGGLGGHFKRLGRITRLERAGLAVACLCLTGGAIAGLIQLHAITAL